MQQEPPHRQPVTSRPLSPQVADHYKFQKYPVYVTYQCLLQKTQKSSEFKANKAK